MKFKPGDKVRFLNESGGGYVTRIINNFMVSVAIEDGFEIPTLMSDLVLIGSKNSNESLFDSKRTIFDNSQEKNFSVEVNQETSGTDESPNTSLSFGVKVPEGVYLVFVPIDQKELTSGKIRVCMVNHTSNQILYSLFLKEEKGYSGIDYGSVSKNSNLVIDVIPREEIEKWSKGLIQVLLHSDKPDKTYMPISENFSFKPSKFFHEAGYTEFGLLSGRKSIIVTLSSLDSLVTTDQAEQLRNIKQSVQDKRPLQKAKPEIDEHRVAPREAEVDLHISAISGKYDKLNPSEILMTQMRYFEHMLGGALSGNYYKVTFIHGIGNGTLRAKIIEYARDYEDIEIKNAPFAKYGNGAIEFILHQNL